MRIPFPVGYESETCDSVPAPKPFKAPSDEMRQLIATVPLMSGEDEARISGALTIMARRHMLNLEQWCQAVCAVMHWQPEEITLVENQVECLRYLIPNAEVPDMNFPPPHEAQRLWPSLNNFVDGTVMRYRASWPDNALKAGITPPPHLANQWPFKSEATAP